MSRNAFCSLCRAWIGVALLGALSGSLAAQEISLNACRPGAVAQGKTTVITLSGAHLMTGGNAAKLWTSFPARVAVLPAGTPNELKYSVHVENDVPIGIAGIRLHSALGTSDSLLIMVDDLSTRQNSGAHNLESAPDIAWPVALEGQTFSLHPNLYRIHGTPGDRLAVEVLAQRLGSNLDPVIRLLDDTGDELAFADDNPSIGADSQFQFIFKKAGLHFLEVHDVEYRGRQPYRIRLGNFPLVAIPFPMAVQNGQETRVSFIGPNDLEPVRIALPPSPSCAVMPISIRQNEFQISGLGSVLSRPWIQVVEQEPNEDPAQALLLNTPCGVSARFNTEKDRDLYEVQALEGEWLTITTTGRRLGSPAHIVLLLRDRAGNVLATTGQGSEPEAVLRARIPHDGGFILVAEDLLGTGGDECGYHLSVQLDQPAFALHLERKGKARDHQVVIPGGYAEWTVQCARFGYDGPIDLSVKGAGDRVMPASGSILPAKKNQTQLRIRFPQSMTLGEPQFLSIWGTASDGPSDHPIRLRTRDQILQRYPSLYPLPPWVNDTLIVTGCAAPFAVKVDETTLIIGQKNKVRIEVTWLEDERKLEKKPVQVSFASLPTDIKPPKAVQVTPKTGFAEMDWEISAEATEGQLGAVQVNASATYFGQSIRVPCAAVAFELKQPPAQPATQKDQ